MPAIQAVRRFIADILAIAPGTVTATIGLTCAEGAAQGASLLVLVPLLHLVGIDAGQGSTGHVMSLFQRGFAAVDVAPTLPLVLSLYVSMVAVMSVLQWQQAMLQSRLREHVVHTLRTRLYLAIAGTSWIYFSRNRASAFGQLLTERLDRVASSVFYVTDLFASAVLALVYVLLAFQVSAAMTTLVVVSGGLLALVLRRRLVAARQAGERYTAVSSSLHAATFEHLGGMKLAKSYAAEQRHAGHFAELSLSAGRASLSSARAFVAVRLWLALGSAVLLALIVHVAHSVLMTSTASLLLIIFLFARLVPRVTGLYEKTQALVGELPAYESLIQAERDCAAAAESAPAAHEPITFARALECRGVSFSYADDRPPALDDLNLTVAAHKTTAIVGPSGVGKSTVADLLMGLLTPLRGAIMVDGVPLSPDRLRSWREKIGYVPQDAFLFHDTVRANLTWACPLATDEMIWRALARAAASDFVRALPHGLDTVVGDRGLLVSGGERQRLSLARALVREPEVLILDEATSSLDSESERRIQDAIERLHEQVTIVVITHRLSTIRNADLIYVLEDGRVVEAGTWPTLFQQHGRFRALCHAQGVAPAHPANAGDGLAIR